MAADIVTRYRALDRKLVANGWPATSPWWLDTLRRFYDVPRRRLVLRVGRRGGKSSTLCRVAVVEALHGRHVVPPGDIGWFVFVSTTKDEAAARLRTIRAILDVLGIAHDPAPDGILLRDRPIGFRVTACTIRSVVGFTSIGLACDELARWNDADTATNPADDVLASLRPTTATMPSASEFLSSSPLGIDDAHARAFDEGDSDHQLVAEAATWIAHPALTEEDTHRLEPDTRIWSREYGARPQASRLGAFDVAAVDRAFERGRTLTATRLGAPVMVIDASSGKKDAWTWAVVRWVQSDDEHAPEVLRFTRVGGISGEFWGQASGAAIVSQLADICREEGITHVHGDQRESLMLRSAFSGEAKSFAEHVWTSTSKPAAVEKVRRWFADGLIALPEHEQLRRELLAFEERITPSGAFTFGARGSGHDDFVALLLTCAMVDTAGALHSIAATKALGMRAPRSHRYRSPLEGMGPALSDGEGSFDSHDRSRTQQLADELEARTRSLTAQVQHVQVFRR